MIIHKIVAFMIVAAVMPGCREYQRVEPAPVPTTNSSERANTQELSEEVVFEREGFLEVDFFAGTVNGISVGMPAEDVIEKLGEPEDRSMAWWCYPSHCVGRECLYYKKLGVIFQLGGRRSSDEEVGKMEVFWTDDSYYFDKSIPTRPVRRIRPSDSSLQGEPDSVTHNLDEHFGEGRTKYSKFEDRHYFTVFPIIKENHPERSIHWVLESSRLLKITFSD